MTLRPGTAAAAVIAVAVAAGCGGGSVAAPKEDPGQVLKSVVKYELAGQRGSSYAMLVREQRKAVSRSLYTKCSPGPPVQESQVSVGITGVRDERISVPALGETKTKAVGYRIVFHDGTDPIVSTGHLIAQDGHWRWTLSPASFESFSDGACP